MSVRFVKSISASIVTFLHTKWCIIVPDARVSHMLVVVGLELKPTETEAMKLTEIRWMLRRERTWSVVDTDAYYRPINSSTVGYLGE